MEASACVGEGDGKTKRNVYQIGGIPVDFPHKAYGSQLAFMGRVISTLDRAQKQGHCHALLESPTGTGKTLSLLCSTLAWQKSYSSRYSAPSPSPPKRTVGKVAQTQPAPEGPDPFVEGGGFIPDPESSREDLSSLILASLNCSLHSSWDCTHLTLYFFQKIHPPNSETMGKSRSTLLLGYTILREYNVLNRITCNLSMFE